jgi:hypothetical protein
MERPPQAWILPVSTFCCVILYIPPPAFSSVTWFPTCSHHVALTLSLSKGDVITKGPRSSPWTTAAHKARRAPGSQSKQSHLLTELLPLPGKSLWTPGSPPLRDN